MLRAEVRTVKAVGITRTMLLVLAALLTTGCFAHRYPGLMQKHLEVLGLYADKLQAFAQDRHSVPAQDWGEFTYPLERARDFARVAKARYPERASLKGFLVALDAYAALVADPGILTGPDAGAVVAARAGAFRTAAEAARAALARER
jgi:hypothetical protein